MNKLSYQELIDKENEILEENNNRLTSNKSFCPDDPELEEVNEIVRQHRSHAKKSKAK